jgi:hypothetical protein
MKKIATVFHLAIFFIQEFHRRRGYTNGFQSIHYQGV